MGKGTTFILRTAATFAHLPKQRNFVEEIRLNIPD